MNHTFTPVRNIDPVKPSCESHQANQFHLFNQNSSNITAKSTKLPTYQCKQWLAVSQRGETRNHDEINLEILEVIDSNRNEQQCYQIPHKRRQIKKQKLKIREILHRQELNDADRTSNFLRSNVKWRIIAYSTVDSEREREDLTL